MHNNAFPESHKFRYICLGEVMSEVPDGGVSEGRFFAVKRGSILHIWGLKSTSRNTPQHQEAGEFRIGAILAEVLRRFRPVRNCFPCFQNFLGLTEMFCASVYTTFIFSESEKIQGVEQNFLEENSLISRQDMRGGTTPPSCPAARRGLIHLRFNAYSLPPSAANTRSDSCPAPNPTSKPISRPGNTPK